MPQDQLFKELLQEFFREFIELFYPNVAARLDFNRVTFLDKEAFTDLSVGERREADLVAQVHPIGDGEPEMILIHIEVQSDRRRTFPRRMFEYYMLFNLRYKLPIYPIAIYLAPGTGGLNNESYFERLFGETFLHFQYKTIGLPDLSAEDYIAQPNPLGPTLSALMRFRRNLSFAQRKATILRQRAIIETNEARRILLLNLIDNAIKLDDAQQGEFQQLIATHESEEVRQMITSYEQRGIEIGLQQGMQRMTLKMLANRFGTPPPATQARIEAITDPAELDKLFDQIAAAKSIDEVNQYLN